MFISGFGGLRHVIIQGSLNPQHPSKNSFVIHWSSIEWMLSFNARRTREFSSLAVCMENPSRLFSLLSESDCLSSLSPEPTSNRHTDSRLIYRPPVSSVRDLGIFVDSDLVMRTHVCQTVSRCFAALRQLRSIRQSSPRLGDRLSVACYQ